MMKYLITIIATIFVLSGCGSKANVSEEQDNRQDEVATSNDEENNDGGETSTDDSTDVEITLPVEFFEGQSEDEVIAGFEEEGISDITVNDDGSYTLTMTAAEHENLLSELKSEIDQDTEMIIESMDLDFVEEISMN